MILSKILLNETTVFIIIHNIMKYITIILIR